ncbi:MAG: phosphoribosylaminoimidazolesuccinocarboxamide synthase [Nitrospirae bacterium GWC2_57_9]|nr:MAG: phosphoribosylaminoimidazolesuccinocarboxamide synthase [Nitrospirae bacterium GWC2_57_9]
MRTPTVLETNLEGLNPPKRGKVRDIYDLGDSLLIVATDRISAFDVILPNAVPEKGRVLTKISAFWFGQTEGIIRNHLISTEVKDYPSSCRPHAEILKGRSMLVKKARSLPVECIVRGYLTGSGLKEYRSTGAVSGIKLPPGLTEASRLPEPLFTPSTKAEVGEHDVNIDFTSVVKLVGKDVAEKIRSSTLAVYEKACRIAETKGIIIADTKLEFGIYQDEVILIDEVLTPDSSRFWPKSDYRAGVPQKSFDKQFVRDYLLSLKWNQKPPAPVLPEEVVRRTSEKYLEVLAMLAG